MELKYPQLIERIKATFADTFFILAFLLFVGYLFQTNDAADSDVKKIIIVLTIVIYEPLLVSLLGGTLGHKMMGLMVRDVETVTKKINFFKAFIRFLLKSIFGWISLLTVTSDDKKRALHDKAVGAVVLIKES